MITGLVIYVTCIYIYTLLGTNISHLRKRKIVFKRGFSGGPGTLDATVRNKIWKWYATHILQKSILFTYSTFSYFQPSKFEIFHKPSHLDGDSLTNLTKRPCKGWPSCGVVAIICPPFFGCWLVIHHHYFRGKPKNQSWLVRTTPNGPCCDPGRWRKWENPGCENDWNITISTAQRIFFGFGKPWVYDRYIVFCFMIVWIFQYLEDPIGIKKS